MSTAELDDMTGAATTPRSRRGEPTWELALDFPRQGEWTEQEYLALHSQRQVELVDGCLEFLPMAGPLHQRVFRFLFVLLNGYVTAKGLGEIFSPPVAIRLWRGRYRDPDLTFFRAGREPPNDRQPDAPDFVLEIVSPGDDAWERDYEHKREDYARAGISEYWIVNPQDRSVTVLQLDNGQYRERARLTDGETATSEVINGFTVAVTEIFAAAEVGQRGEAQEPEAEQP
jgi:Uma2 family endonuclease